MTNTILGFCLGLLFTAGLVGFFPGKNFEDMQKAIKDCEKSLPRNVHCAATAKPILENK